MNDSLRTQGPATLHSAAEDTRARLAAACASLACEPRLEDARSLLVPLVEASRADRASILALDPATGHLAIVAAIGLPANLLGQETTPRPRCISEWVFRNRRGLILNGEVRDQRFEGSATADGIDSALSLPLLSQGAPVGVLNLARVSPAPAFTEAAMAELEGLVVPLADALARTQRSQGLLRTAASLARRATGSGSPLLPRGCSEPRCYELALGHRPSAVPAGDLCDRAAHPAGDQSLLVLDPPGRGGLAASTAAFLQGGFVILATPERSAAGLAARLGSELHGRLGPEHATAAWIAQLSPRGDLSYCNAGHTPPLWLPADGSDVVRLDRGGPLLGALSWAPYEEEHLRLLPGDIVLTASDGVVAGRGSADEPFGLERLAELVSSLRARPLERLVEEVIEAASAYSGRPVPIDDLTVLALRFRPEG